MKRKRKKIIGILIVVVILLAVLDFWGFLSAFPGGLKTSVTLSVGDEQYFGGDTRARTVCDLAQREGFRLDGLQPISRYTCESAIHNDMTIIYAVEENALLRVDGEERQISFLEGDDPRKVIGESVELGQEDIVEMKEGVVTVTRVKKEKVIEKKRIYFQEEFREDPEREIGDDTVEVEGVEGEEEIIYEVIYHDGGEISREEVSREVTKEKTDRVVIKGTREKEEEVVLGKSHTGQASWYAYKDCDCAANPWLPKGSRVKVTAVNSGRSVIVKINDRGPFVPGRIIDLDKTAFEKIAPLGAGVIDIKMEEVVE